jgi:thiosulfate dehydrogenase (quinone) large subunit
MFEESKPWRDDISQACAILRVSLGLNICLHGVVRWAAGLRSFAQSLVPMFEKTILPPWSVYSFGVMLPVLEAVIGAAVLVGFNSRRFLTFGAVLMLVLMLDPRYVRTGRPWGYNSSILWSTASCSRECHSTRTA